MHADTELERLEESYTAFKVECERIRHELDVLSQRIDEDEARDTFAKRRRFSLLRSIIN